MSFGVGLENLEEKLEHYYGLLNIATQALRLTNDKLEVVLLENEALKRRVTELEDEMAEASSDAWGDTFDRVY